MDSELANLASEVDANLSHAETILHGLSRAQFNWRSEPGRWSIAECLAHLNLVNGSDLDNLKRTVEQAQSAGIKGEGPFTYGTLSRKFIASQEPPITRKFKAPKTYVPPADSGLDETFTEYRRVLGELRKIILRSDGLHLAKVKTTLPALPALLRAVIKMPLGARLHLITTHDRRHLWQAEQVRNHPSFPR